MISISLRGQTAIVTSAASDVGPASALVPIASNSAVFSSSNFRHMRPKILCARLFRLSQRGHGCCAVCAYIRPLSPAPACLDRA
jgi:hypothetical protein